MERFNEIETDFPFEKLTNLISTEIVKEQNGTYTVMYKGKKYKNYKKYNTAKKCIYELYL